LVQVELAFQQQWLEQTGVLQYLALLHRLAAEVEALAAAVRQITLAQMAVLAAALLLIQQR
jgi:hypothetical protein